MSEWKELTGIVEVAEAVAAGMEIEVRYPQTNSKEWVLWAGNTWYDVAEYCARPRKSAMKKVKSLCWRHMNTGDLIWLKAPRVPLCVSYQHFPAGDIEGEVEA